MPESVANVFPRGSLYDEFDRYCFYTDQEVRLVLRKKLPREPLVNRLQERHRFPSDGSLTLPVDRAGAKQLQVQLVTSPAPPGDIRFDWELRIRPKDGKIQVKTERLQMLAPEDGYLPEITLARRIDGEIWVPGEEAEFFIRFDDWNYAWCRISCDARERFLYYDCNYNPAQSRNLEPGLKVE